MISRRAPLYLNSHWRITGDELQWILEYRKTDKPTSKSTGWRGRSFHRRRDSLLRRIEELCGSVDADILARLADLPEWHT